MIKCSSLFQSPKSHQDSRRDRLLLHPVFTLFTPQPLTAQTLNHYCSVSDAFMLYKPHFLWLLLSCCHKAAIWTSALHTSITQSAAFISFQSNGPLSWPPPRQQICFCGINVPLELVLWSRTQNLGELHKYVQKAEHVAELWGGKDSTVDPRWQLEIWLTLETHGNNGGWSAKKKKEKAWTQALGAFAHVIFTFY